MEAGEKVDTAYPVRWIGKVTVYARDGRCLSARVDEPKGDPGNTLSRAEIEDEALRLGTYRNAADEDAVRRLIAQVWSIADSERVDAFMRPNA